MKRKIIELSKLPKHPSLLKSLNLRLTTPGSASSLLYPSGGKQKSVDPSHASNTTHALRTTAYPSYRSPLLGLRAFPKAFLAAPKLTLPCPPYCPPSGKGKRSADASVMLMTMSHSSGLNAVARFAVKRRMKEAVALIATRGARAEGERIVFEDGDVGARKWLLQDWTYVFSTRPEVYCLPWPELISEVRTALEAVQQGTRQIEESWTKPSEQTSKVKPKNRPRPRVLQKDADPEPPFYTWHDMFLDPGSPKASAEWRTSRSSDPATLS